MKALIILVLASGTAFAQIEQVTGVTVQTVVGSGFKGHVDGVGQETMFSHPKSIARFPDGLLLVHESGAKHLRLVDAALNVTTVSADSFTPIADMVPYGNDILILTEAGLFWSISRSLQKTRITFNPVPGITDITIHGGFVFAVSPSEDVVKRIKLSPLSATVYAGSGNQGSVDGRGIFSSFENPTFIEASQSGVLYVSQTGNNAFNCCALRVIATDASVTTPILASNHYFNGDIAIASNGDVFISDDGRVLRINAEGKPELLATGFYGDMLVEPDGSLIVADTFGHRIRRIVFEAQEEVVDPASLSLSSYPGLTVTGLVGRTYRIESSTSASGQWSAVETIRLPESPYLWIDRRGLTEKQFYRAVLLP